MVNGTTFAPRAEVVVVAGHERFDYEELKVATQAVLRGADLIGAGRDATFPMPDGLWPATGAVLAAVETATGVRAETVGKPEPQLFLTALDRLGTVSRGRSSWETASTPTRRGRGRPGWTRRSSSPDRRVRRRRGRRWERGCLVGVKPDLASLLLS